MKTFITILSLFVLLGFSGVDSSVSDVYICKGKYSKKYHYDKNCRGLSNCKADIILVDLQDAKKIGRDLCGWEK